MSQGLHAGINSRVLRRSGFISCDESDPTFVTGVTDRRSPRGPTTRRRCDDLLPKSGLGVSRSVTDARSGSALFVALNSTPSFSHKCSLTN